MGILDITSVQKQGCTFISSLIFFPSHCYELQCYNSNQLSDNVFIFLDKIDSSPHFCFSGERLWFLDIKKIMPEQMLSASENPSKGELLFSFSKINSMLDISQPFPKLASVIFKSVFISLSHLIIFLSLVSFFPFIFHLSLSS